MKKPKNSCDLEKYLNKARKSISNYCVLECNAFCCRKGILILNEFELKLIFNNKDINNILLNNFSVKKYLDTEFLLDLGNLNYCPQLTLDFKCQIHNAKHRSKTCSEYPIFLLENGSIKISQRCFAFKDNKFYPYIYQLKKWKYNII